MKKSLHLLMMAVFTTTLTNCAKIKLTSPVAPPDVLPPITQEGKMTVGCLVNDTVLIHKVPHFPVYSRPDNGPDFRYDTTSKELYIHWIHSSNQTRLEQTLLLSGHIDHTGAYAITSPTKDIGINYRRRPFDSNNAPGIIYAAGQNDHTQLGALEITKFDTTRHIIAGTFYFTLAASGADTLRFTQGRFDMHY